MSGGHYDYAYHSVNNFADELQDVTTNPLRRAFQKHCYKVAKAMHDIEWVDSGDKRPGEEEEAIKAVLPEGSDLDEAVSIGKETIDVLNKLLKDIEDTRRKQ